MLPLILHWFTFNEEKKTFETLASSQDKTHKFFLKASVFSCSFSVK